MTAPRFSPLSAGNADGRSAADAIRGPRGGLRGPFNARCGQYNRRVEGQEYIIPQLDPGTAERAAILIVARK
jgi:hypothetical protein